MRDRLFSGMLRCGLQCFSFETSSLPIIQKFNIVIAEKTNRRAIPVQNIHHDAKAILGQGDVCYTRQQSVTNPFSAKLSANVEVFEEKSATSEGGITVEEESIPGWLTIPFGQ